MEDTLTEDAVVTDAAAEVDPLDEAREALAAEEAAAAAEPATGTGSPAAADSGSGDSEPPADPPAEDDSTRRGRGGLELDVREITNQFVQGQITLGDSELMTPHRISALIEGKLGSKASTGAVSNVLKRWYEIGFCVVNDKPFAFTDYTDAARREGLTALKEKATAARKQARADAKAEATPADDAAKSEAA